MFRPYSQVAWPSMTITVKAAAEPMPLASPVRSALSADRSAINPVTRIRTMDRSSRSRSARGGSRCCCSARFRPVALRACRDRRLRRRQLRRLAADSRDRDPDGARRARRAGGAPRGAPVAYADRRWASSLASPDRSRASRLLGTLLYRVEPADPVVLAAIVFVLGASAIVACLVPARRAASVDPLVVLRDE